MNRRWKPIYRVETRGGKLLWKGNSFYYAKALSRVGDGRQIFEYCRLHDRYYIMNPYYLAD